MIPSPLLRSGHNLSLLAFDFGHTLVDERQDFSLPLGSRPIRLMPGVQEVLPQLGYRLAVWANTRVSNASDLRQILEHAGIARFFSCVITSVDAGARKPERAFFDFALHQCRVSRPEVLFVGNQLNTDIAGGRNCGIRTVWLSGVDYLSGDDDLTADLADPTFTLSSFFELPGLLRTLNDSSNTLP